MMVEETFDGQILAEKLSKLNNSQQSIESLSRWCISFRKKAKQIIETWDKLFKSAQREQRVSFLYLANDILQNSRRKGSEFVNEFWKVLPSALKHVYETGDEHGKKAATRLVDIWEERNVFGSRGQNLKDAILGKNPSSSVSNGKSSNPIKVLKKDAHSLRIKLAVGGLPEKIISTFQLVHDGNINEEAAINKCEGAISCVGEMEKDVGNFSNQGSLQGSELVDKIKEQEEIIWQCVSQLENAEATRVALVSHLKEALQDQEKKLEQLRSKLQVARGQIERATNTRQRLTSPTLHALSSTNTIMQMETIRAVESNLHPSQLNSAPPLPLSTLPVTSFATPKVSDEESKKAAAAALVAKLAASTSSAQMLTSVLSSLVAEEAASMSTGLKSAGFSSSLPFALPEKRPKLEKPMQFSDVNNPKGGNFAYFGSTQQQPVTNVPLAPSTGMRPNTQANQIQAPFQPPPPHPLPANTPINQLVQSSAEMMGVMPYGYATNNLPPPPLPTYTVMGLARPAPPPQQLQTQQPQSQQPQQQQQANGGYYRPPGINGFYGQSHQTATSPLPRQ